MLNILGIWKESEEKRSFFFECKFYGTAILLLYFIILPQIVYIFLSYSDIDIIVEILTTNLTIIVALIKHFTLCNKIKDLQPLLDYMKEDWINVKNKIHLPNMRRIGHQSSLLALYLSGLTQIMVALFAVMNIYMIKNGFYPTKRFFYLTIYPYDAYSTPLFELTCLFQYIAAVLSALAYTNADSFIALLLFHICGQLNVLQYDLQHLTDPAVNGNKNAIDIIKKNLSYIIRRHEHLIRCGDTVENCFNIMLLVQMVSLSLQLCFQGYVLYDALIGNKDTNVLQITFLSIYTVSVVSLFCLYCYVGDQVSSESLEVGNATYKCNWFYLPPNEIKSLIFIIVRTNNPICITAGKFCTFTMVTFSEVIKRAFGYLSVLLTMKAK